MSAPASTAPTIMEPMGQGWWRCAMCDSDVEQGAELCRACRAAFARTIARGRQGAERWWVLATLDDVVGLHHAALGEVDALAWGEGAPRLADVLLSCAVPAMVDRANVHTARALERCRTCCAVTGYMNGMGAPERDSACATRLLERLREVGW